LGCHSNQGNTTLKSFLGISAVGVHLAGFRACKVLIALGLDGYEQRFYGDDLELLARVARGSLIA
jgi:hypothetical protein